MHENLQLQGLELRSRSEPELVGERSLGATVDLKRCNLASRPVEREHQLPDEPLAQRVIADEPFELAHDLGATACGELDGDSLLDDIEPSCL